MIRIPSPEVLVQGTGQLVFAFVKQNIPTQHILDHSEWMHAARRCRVIKTGRQEFSKPLSGVLTNQDLCRPALDPLQELHAESKVPFIAERIFPAERVGDQRAGWLVSRTEFRQRG